MDIKELKKLINEEVERVKQKKLLKEAEEKTSLETPSAKRYFGNSEDPKMPKDPSKPIPPELLPKSSTTLKNPSDFLKGMQEFRNTLVKSIKDEDLKDIVLNTSGIEKEKFLKSNPNIDLNVPDKIEPEDWYKGIMRLHNTLRDKLELELKNERAYQIVRLLTTREIEKLRKEFPKLQIGARLG